MFQKTLKQKISFSGIGVHSGQPSMVTIHPAPAHHGIVFCNANNHLQRIVIGSVVPEQAMHATVIKGDGWLISTIEHIMAAVLVLGVDNATIELQGYEVPILDGSALPFVQGILDSGLEDQTEKRSFLAPLQSISLSDEQGRSIEIIPGDETKQLSIDYATDLGHPCAGPGYFKGEITPEYFIDHIAPARTFGFLEQLPFLRQHKLAQGSSLSNTIVIGQEVLNELRFPDECVRHKVLDLLGDVSLVGKPLVGSIIARKTSHNFNRLVVEHYIKNPTKWQIL